MKHAFLLFFAALFAASSSFADLSVETDYGTNDAADDGTYDALNGATVVAEVSGGNPKYVYIDWEQDDTKVRIYLTGAGQEWSGTLPPAHAGSFSATTFRSAENVSSLQLDC